MQNVDMNRGRIKTVLPNECFIYNPTKAGDDHLRYLMTEGVAECVAFVVRDFEKKIFGIAHVGPGVYLPTETEDMKELDPTHEQTGIILKGLSPTIRQRFIKEMTNYDALKNFITQLSAEIQNKGGDLSTMKVSMFGGVVKDPQDAHEIIAAAIIKAGCHEGNIKSYDKFDNEHHLNILLDMQKENHPITKSQYKIGYQCPDFENKIKELELVLDCPSEDRMKRRKQITGKINAPRIAIHPVLGLQFVVDKREDVFKVVFLKHTKEIKESEQMQGIYTNTSGKEVRDQSSQVSHDTATSVDQQSQTSLNIHQIEQDNCQLYADLLKSREREQQLMETNLNLKKALHVANHTIKFADKFPIRQKYSEQKTNTNQERSSSCGI